MIASNSRAELGGILEALRQNETEMGSESLTSLEVICTYSDRYEDLNWSRIQKCRSAQKHPNQTENQTSPNGLQLGSKATKIAMVTLGPMPWPTLGERMTH